MEKNVPRNAKEHREYCRNSGDCLELEKIDSVSVHDKIKFYCPKHGEYYQEIRRHYMGCRKCSKSRASLVWNTRQHEATYFSEDFINSLAYEIDKERARSNSLLTSEEVDFYCSKHGVYRRVVSDRYVKSTHKLKGCPYCNMEGKYKAYSKREKTVLEYVKSLYTGEVIPNHRGLVKLGSNWMEVDIYLPDLGLAFEVDGSQYHTENCTKEEYYSTYHKNRQHMCWYGYHEFKDRAFLDKGVRIVHIEDNDDYQEIVRRELECLS